MRYLVLLALASCATDTSKLEARVHDLEKEVAELRAKETSRDEASGCAKTTDVSVPDAVVFSSAVPFAISESHRGRLYERRRQLSRQARVRNVRAQVARALRR